MAAKVTKSEVFNQAVAKLEGLCQFSGGAKAFWSTCLSVLGGVAGARVGVLLREGPEEAPGWESVLVLPSGALSDAGAREFLAAAGDEAEACVLKGGACSSLRASGGASGDDWCLAVRLATESEDGVWVAAFLVPSVSETEAEEALRRLRLLAFLPGIYEANQQISRSEIAVEHFASVLDLVALMNAQHRFLAVAMTLCNEVATRHQCERVSLGWLEKDYVELKAISHSERFERKMGAIKALEAAMEEALDQDEVIIMPEPGEQHLVTREHKRFVTDQQVKSLCSLPLRLDGESVAVLTCERSGEAFSEVELRLLALCGEMGIRRLGDLKRTDRWFGARWATSAREGFEKLVGPEHSVAKLIGLAVVLGLLVLLFGHTEYRVDAPFALRTENAAFLSAPFDGYLGEVKYEVGDEVSEGKVLVSLDTRDLLLEEANAIADQTRFVREAEKASAADKIADMRIAQAQAEQSRVRLELVRYRLGQAQIKAPFAGVVVEGDLKKRIGAPVKQGEMLLRVGQVDHMYVECSVAERDIHEVMANAGGEIAFASMPKWKFPVRVQRIEPAAQTVADVNAYMVRCQFKVATSPWWRPGMTGVAKINAGRRTLLWVATHRTVEFFRIHFWW